MNSQVSCEPKSKQAAGTAQRTSSRIGESTRKRIAEFARTLSEYPGSQDLSLSTSDDEEEEDQQPGQEEEGQMTPDAESHRPGPGVGGQATRIQSLFSRKGDGVWTCYSCQKDVSDRGDALDLKYHLHESHPFYFNTSGDIIVNVLHVKAVKGPPVAKELAVRTTRAVNNIQVLESLGLQSVDVVPTLQVGESKSASTKAAPPKKLARPRKTPAVQAAGKPPERTLVMRPHQVFLPSQTMVVEDDSEDNLDLFGRFLASEIRELHYGDVQMQVKQNIMLALFEVLDMLLATFSKAAEERIEDMDSARKMSLAVRLN